MVFTVFIHRATWNIFGLDAGTISFQTSQIEIKEGISIVYGSNPGPGRSLISDHRQVSRSSILTPNPPKESHNLLKGCLVWLSDLPGPPGTCPPNASSSDCWLPDGQFVFWLSANLRTVTSDNRGGCGYRQEI